jgi:hypothetical protein
MFGAVVILLALGFLHYNSARRVSGLKWHEVVAITKWMMLGPRPVAKCRACEKELKDPMLRAEIGYGAFLCEECEELVGAEAGLLLPEWFVNPLPIEDVPQLNKITMAPCSGCGMEKAEVEVCMHCMRKAVGEGSFFANREDRPVVLRRPPRPDREKKI